MGTRHDEEGPGTSEEEVGSLPGQGPHLPHLCWHRRYRGVQEVGSGVRLPGFNPSLTSFQPCDLVTSVWSTQAKLAASSHPAFLLFLLWRNIPPSFPFSTLVEVRLQAWGL